MTLYDDIHISTAPYLRDYCGHILTELFNTNLTTDYDCYTFNN